VHWVQEDDVEDAGLVLKAHNPPESLGYLKLKEGEIHIVVPIVRWDPIKVLPSEPHPCLVPFQLVPAPSIASLDVGEKIIHDHARQVPELR
jgi:hypothetical protein